MQTQSGEQSLWEKRMHMHPSQDAIRKHKLQTSCHIMPKGECKSPSETSIRLWNTVQLQLLLRQQSGSDRAYLYSSIYRMEVIMDPNQ